MGAALRPYPWADAAQGNRLKAITLVFAGLDRQGPLPRAQAFAPLDAFRGSRPEMPTFARRSSRDRSAMLRPLDATAPQDDLCGIRPTERPAPCPTR